MPSASVVLRRILRIQIVVAVELAVVAVATAGVLFLIQGRMIYAGQGGPPATPTTGWTTIRLPSPDGPLAAYYLPARPTRHTVVFLHGNATDFRGSRVATAGFAQRGDGVLIVEYPGYGGNPGKPNEASIAAAADRAYDWLRAQGVATGDIDVYGNSIGSGPAIHLAHRPHGRLILTSPVASMIDVVHARLPYVPKFLLRDRWRNAEAIRDVEGPILVIHARDDDVVPFTQGVTVARSGRAEMVALTQGGHQIAFTPAVVRLVAGTR